MNQICEEEEELHGSSDKKVAAAFFVSRTHPPRRRPSCRLGRNLVTPIPPPTHVASPAKWSEKVIYNNERKSACATLCGASPSALVSSTSAASRVGAAAARRHGVLDRVQLGERVEPPLVAVAEEVAWCCCGLSLLLSSERV